MPDTTDSYSLTGLDNPFGTSSTYGGTNIATGSLPTGGSTYGDTNISVGWLPDTPVDRAQTLSSSTPSASSNTDTSTASSNTDLSFLNNIGGFLSNNAGNIASIGSAAYLAKQQQDANSKLAGQLRDQSTPILKSGQDQLANYQNLTDLQKKALESGVSTGSTLTGLADPLLGIGKDAFSQYTGGQLPAWQQAEIDQKVAQAKALARQSLGANVDSSTLSQVDSQIDQQAEISKGQLMEQNLASGEKAYDQGAGYTLQGGAYAKAAYDKASADITSNLHNALDTITVGLGPLSDSIKYEIAGNTALQKSMQDLYGALAKAGTTAGGGTSGGGIGSVIGGVKSIYDKVIGGGTPAVTPPGIDAMVKGIPSPPTLPPPVLPPMGGPAASVGPEPLNPDTPLYGPDTTAAGDPTGTAPTDTTGTQPTDTTGTQPTGTQPTGTQPQAANTGAGGVSSGAQLAQAVGATGAAAAALAAVSAAAVPHVSALIVAEELGAAAASSASGAAAVAATSEALAAAGVSTEATAAVGAEAASAVAAGTPVASALAAAAETLLPIAAAAAVVMVLEKLNKTSPEQMKIIHGTGDMANAANPSMIAAQQYTTTPNASNTSPEELAALYQSAGGMDTGFFP